jgi:hypothetical protein
VVFFDDQVQVVPEQGGEQVRPEGEVDLQFGVGGEEGLHVPHQDAAPEFDRGPHAEAAPRVRVVPPKIIGRGVERGKDLLAGQEKAPPFLREAQFPPPAVQQGGPGETLQLGHGMADRGLGPVQPTGAGGETARLRQGVEGAELGQIEQGVHVYESYSCLM